MALIKCNSCGAEISDRATSCPHCGYLQKNGDNMPHQNSFTSAKPKSGKGWMIYSIIVTICLIGVCAWAFVGKTVSKSPSTGSCDYLTQAEIDSLSTFIGKTSALSYRSAFDSTSSLKLNEEEVYTDKLVAEIEHFLSLPKVDQCALMIIAPAAQVLLSSDITANTEKCSSAFIEEFEANKGATPSELTERSIAQQREYQYLLNNVRNRVVARKAP